MKQSTELVTLLSVAVAAWLIHRSIVLKEELLTFRLDHLNNTKFANQQILIFNRVPKVGSEMVWSLIDLLSSKNKFMSYSDSMVEKDKRGRENTYMPHDTERRDYVNMLMDKARDHGDVPFTYTKHLNFLDFQEQNLTNPIYINFVRDPVERLISWYYYHRAPWHIIKYNKESNTSYLSPKVPPIRDLKITFEECVLERKWGCIFNVGQKIHGGLGGSHFSQMAFFCGHDKECQKFESEGLFARARENVDKHFAVVGVLEELQKSLQVLEGYLPRFFRDARKHYKEVLRTKHKNKNKLKVRPSPEVIRMIARNFTREYEFYHYCRQRLNNQADLLQL